MQVGDHCCKLGLLPWRMWNWGPGRSSDLPEVRQPAEDKLQPRASLPAGSHLIHGSGSACRQPTTHDAVWPHLSREARPRLWPPIQQCICDSDSSFTRHSSISWLSFLVWLIKSARIYHTGLLQWLHDLIYYSTSCSVNVLLRASLVAQWVKNPPAMQETLVWFPGQGLPTPVFLPGESPWREEPGGPQFMGLQRDGHEWATRHSANVLFTSGALLISSDSSFPALPQPAPSPVSQVTVNSHTQGKRLGWHFLSVPLPPLHLVKL